MNLGTLQDELSDCTLGAGLGRPWRGQADALWWVRGFPLAASVVAQYRLAKAQPGVQSRIGAVAAGGGGKGNRCLGSTSKCLLPIKRNTH